MQKHKEYKLNRRLEREIGLLVGKTQKSCLSQAEMGVLQKDGDGHAECNETFVYCSQVYLSMSKRLKRQTQLD